MRSLLAREKPGGGTKSLVVISSPSYNTSSTTSEEPEIYEIEILQPPTREDWITKIRKAGDAAPPGSDDEDEGVRAIYY